MKKKNELNIISIDKQACNGSIFFMLIIVFLFYILSLLFYFQVLKKSPFVYAKYEEIDKNFRA
jgi:hypothetical protein